VEAYLQFLVLGIAAGSIYAALALGVVITYRASRVINFAYGAMAMYVAYVYVGLTNDGRYMVPPLPNPLAPIGGISQRFFHHHIKMPSWPVFIKVSSQPVGIPLALVLSLATALVLGFIVQWLIFRPLRHAPMLAKLVATIGVLLVLQQIAVLRFTSSPQNTRDILPTTTVRLFGANVPENRFYLLAIIVAVTIGLKLLYKYTPFGVATRAAAENEKGAILVGLDPDRLATVNWLIASFLAGLFGILVTPITSIDPATFPAFIIPALAAALVANFTSYEIAVATALGIGALESVTLRLQSDFSWIPQIGLRSSIAFIVIVLAMVLRGRVLPSRGEIGVGRQAPAPEPRNLGRNTLIMCVIGIPAAIYLPAVWRGAFVNTSIGVIMALSLVVIVGFVGQISFAQLAFAGIAAFLLGEFATQWGIPFPFAPLLACAGSVVVGVLAGLPALRVRGVNLAVLTLGLALVAEKMIFQNKAFDGGIRGRVVAAPELFGIKFGPNSPFFLGDHDSPRPSFVLFTFLVAVVLAVGVANLRRGTMGRRMIALRTNERAAASIGMSVMSTKLFAFGISALIAGVAGCLNTYQVAAVSGDPYAAIGTFAILAIAFLGGITTIRGAVIAGMLAGEAFFSRISQSLFHAGQWFPLVTALGLLVTVLLNPEGISGGLEKSKRQALNLIAARRSGQGTAAALRETSAEGHGLAQVSAPATPKVRLEGVRE
jgi:branched-chain amino acid transport system permease protein